LCFPNLGRDAIRATEAKSLAISTNSLPGKVLSSSCGG
jgi:hypothetical protein